MKLNGGTDLVGRIKALSPEKRTLLERRLKQAHLNVPTEQRIPNLANYDSVPLSFAQQRLWFLAQLEPDSPLYNIGTAVRLDGPLNLGVLRKALDTIVSRHAILRTTFVAVDGVPSQVIAKKRPAELEVIRLSQLPMSEQQEEVRRLLKERARRPFNLAADLMFRTTLLELGQEEHVLFLLMHHIASDGWSLGVLFRELSILYEAFSAGKSSPLPDPAIQYADFAAWQRQRLQGEALEKQLSYWKQQFNGFSPMSVLPTDRPRPAEQTFRGARQSFMIPATLAEELRAIARREQVTLFMTLLAAFKVFLYRYSGEDDIVVGTPIAGRNRAEVEGLIGFFVNTLVLRTGLSGDLTFRELLGRVREVALGAYAHQDLPFEKLVEELQPERDLSRNPLFQVMFALQNVPRHTLKLAGLEVSSVAVGTGTAKFDLSLSVLEEQRGGLRASLEYNTDLFDAATTERMLGHWRNLLEGVVADPEQRISELPLLTQAERHQLLVGWNETKTDYPNDKCIHELFEAQVEQSPDAVAVVFEDKALTYGELNRRANQLAHYLRKLGVGPEARVGICVERSLEMVIGLLGILKAGGAYVPLDTTYPRERLSFMLSDARVQVLLTQRQLFESLPVHGAQIVCVDSEWEVIARGNEDNAINAVRPENLAYVVYTSGSTGAPKGVQITHGSVVNFLNSMRQRPGLTDQDILVAVTTLSFDIAGLELYLPLSVGARVEILSREATSDGKQLLEKLDTSGATVMQATPATWRLLLEAGWRGSPLLKILCGGEALPRELAAQLATRGSSLWNLYGPTETTIWSAFKEVEVGRGVVTIGRPIGNTEIYILDSDLQPVPVGMSGELYIGGKGLARGYLGHSDLTAEKFVPNPFGKKAGARLYRTGDLARYCANGKIEFLGRVDHQVKVRGFRIELGEIEATLEEHPAIKAAVVAARERGPDDTRLVAYYLLNHLEPEPTVSELRAYVRTKLPEYMVPAAFVTLDRLPLTPSGKVDRRALPDPDGLHVAESAGYVAPRTAMEELIAKIWQELLGVERVGVHDNFFDLGGHSLLSMRVIARIERESGQRISPREILFQTLGQLAAACEERAVSCSAASAKGVAGRVSDAIKKALFRARFRN